MTSQSIILTYISSSEFNRMRFNGIDIRCTFEFDILKFLETASLTKKLKRKLRTLHHMGVISMPRTPLIGVDDVAVRTLNAALCMKVLQKYMQIEDDLILKGKITNSSLE